MQTCPACGNEQDNQAIFCEECHARLVAPPAPPHPLALIVGGLLALGLCSAAGLVIAFATDLPFSPVPCLYAMVGAFGLGLFGFYAFYTREGMHSPSSSVLVVCSWVLLAFVLLVYLRPMLRPPWNQLPARATCLSNQRLIAIAAESYSEDHRMRYPPDLSALRVYGIGRAVRTCPDSGGGYGLNREMAGIFRYTLTAPAAALLTADGAVADSLLTKPEQIARERHAIDGRHGCIAGYTDGHAAFLPADAPVRLVVDTDWWGGFL